MDNFSGKRMKKVLAILGSPRASGNASKMLDIAINQAEMQNYEVTRVNLFEKSIAYCTGCMKCRENGVCIIKDDLQDICRIKAMKEFFHISGMKCKGKIIFAGTRKKEISASIIRKITKIVSKRR